MRRIVVVGAVLAAPMLAAAGVAVASGSGPYKPGFIHDPLAGAEELAIADVPPAILHSARVALDGGEVTGAQLDRDAPLAIYEIAGTTGNTEVEVDVRPDATIEEIEVLITDADVPDVVSSLLASVFPDFVPETIEKSIRPTEIGLLETWYEFGGAEFDVEINSTATEYLVEPA